MRIHGRKERSAPFASSIEFRNSEIANTPSRSLWEFHRKIFLFFFIQQHLVNSKVFILLPLWAILSPVGLPGYTLLRKHLRILKLKLDWNEETIVIFKINNLRKPYSLLQSICVIWRVKCRIWSSNRDQIRNQMRHLNAAIQKIFLDAVSIRLCVYSSIFGSTVSLHFKERNKFFSLEKN